VEKHAVERRGNTADRESRSPSSRMSAASVAADLVFMKRQDFVEGHGTRIHYSLSRLKSPEY
jgi:hypothetical protein